jgi:hypothetical protein
MLNSHTCTPLLLESRGRHHKVSDVLLVGLIIISQVELTYIKLSLLVLLVSSISTFLLIVILPDLSTVVAVTVALIVNDEIVIPAHILQPLILFFVNLLKDLFALIYLATIDNT